MVEVIKLYLFGLMISAPGTVDQNAIQMAKTQPQPVAIVVRTPALNNYKTCLLSVKKQFTNCTKKTDKSITSHIRSAATIFKKQRICTLKKERNHPRCKNIFLK